MEVYDDPASERVTATFELPGVKIADLSIDVKQGTLVVLGQWLCRYPRTRQHPSVMPEVSAEDAGTPTAESSTRFFPCRELRYGYFHRRLRLSPGVNKITAKLEDRLLTVT
ncbi:hypothetical protein DFH07DRAFT_952863 [Mycena maculata]|uniref:SHSP domain-containing protein n=1 Tax=Mycena maculata TaxID=230809 RepID=A0AAD7JY88_9AGAR|nr:hypothetical protein DFH07DRAFT_952863 [Mycena maculata]